MWLASITDDAWYLELAYSSYSYIQQRMFPDIKFSHIASAVYPRFLYCLTIPGFPRTTTSQLALKIVPLTEPIPVTELLRKREFLECTIRAFIMLSHATSELPKLTLTASTDVVWVISCLLTSKHPRRFEHGAHGSDVLSVTSWNTLTWFRALNISYIYI